MQLARRRKFKLPKIGASFSRQTRSLFKFATALSSVSPAKPATVANARGKTVQFADFGSNPGQLKMFVYTPVMPVPANAPLIVVLHGCGQHAGSFASNSGWIAVANHFRVPLLLPEQVTANNISRCFNWYRPGDSQRGRGEAMSIRQMIRATMQKFSSNKAKVFVVGLSAGGALTAALLAAYPAVFNAGAIVAGMPAGSASNTASALVRMHHANPFTTRGTLAAAITAGKIVRKRKRKWPRISIWHGEKDRTIDPANGAALAAQWSELHGFADLSGLDEVSESGIRRRTWGTAKLPLVEWWTLPEMGHGFPIDAAIPGAGRRGFGIADAGISGAFHIAAFWGLVV